MTYGCSTVVVVASDLSYQQSLSDAGSTLVALRRQPTTARCTLRHSTLGLRTSTLPITMGHRMVLPSITSGRFSSTYIATSLLFHRRLDMTCGLVHTGIGGHANTSSQALTNH